MPDCRILEVDEAGCWTAPLLSGFGVLVKDSPKIPPLDAVPPERCGLGCPAVDSYARPICGNRAVLPLQYSIASAKAGCRGMPPGKSEKADGNEV
jgi:hypothetical protein